MQLKRVEITELKGIDRNAVEGAVQQQPTILIGFDFDKRGGYRAFRGGGVLTTSGTLDDTLIGFDDAGYISFYETGTSTSFPGGEVTLRVYDATSTVEEEVYGFDSGGASTSDSFFDVVHYPQVGALAFTGDVSSSFADAIFLVRKSDGNFIGSSDLYSGTYTVTSTSTSSGSGSIRSNTSIYAGLATDGGTFLTPIAEATGVSVTSTDEFEIDFSWSNAPESWTIYMFAHTATSFDNTNWYVVAPGDASGSDTLTITSGSSVLPDGGYLVQFQDPVALYNRRMYGRLLYPSPGSSAYNYSPVSLGAAGVQSAQAVNSLLNQLSEEKTLWYTEIGFANLMQGTNYFEVPFTISSKITGLAATPAGLLVFGDAETFLVRSDPALDNFSIQLVSGVIGCDEGAQPVRLGGVVFVVYQGEIYSISLGMGDVDFGSGITKISELVYRPETPFEDIAVEASYRQLVAQDSAGTLYRYDFETQQWFNDPVGVSTDGIYSNPDENGVRYYTGIAFFYAYDSLVPPRVSWSDLYLDSKSTHKMWRRVRLFTNDDYSGTPRIDYRINSTNGSITATNEGDGEYVFTFPDGLVSRKIETLEINLLGAVENDTIEAPVVLEYVPRYRRR
jgi:hypothetical protein